MLKEISQCTKAFPNAYIRLVAFDPSRQVQVAGASAGVARGAEAVACLPADPGRQLSQHLLPGCMPSCHQQLDYGISLALPR